MALFGASTVYLRKDVIQSLRSAVAHALIGPWNNVSSWVACSCIVPELMDPMFFTLVEILNDV